MVLTELKSYLQQHQRVTLIDLAYHFNTSPEAIQGMLSHWVNKGKVRILKGSCSKGCCGGTNLEIYEWIVPVRCVIP